MVQPWVTGMTELLSALTIALETSLPERLARGETSVDEFFDAEGFSRNELSREIEQFVSCHTEWKTLLEQLGNDPRAVFRDHQLLNQLIATVSSETEGEAVVMTAGGLGRKIQDSNLTTMRTSLSKTSRSLDPSRYERADSLTESESRGELKDHVEPLRTETRHSGIKQEYSNHEQEIQGYDKLYTKARKKLGQTTRKTIEVAIAKDIVHYQISRFVSGYERALKSNNRNQWAYTGADGLGGFTVRHSLTGDGYVALTVDNDHGRYGETWNADYTFSSQQDNKNNNIYLSKTVGGDWTLSWGLGNWKSTEFRSGAISFSNKQIYEHTKLYQEDKSIVEDYHQGDLLPTKIKERFGKILAVSAIAYNMKRRVAIEKQYWPKTYSNLISRTKKGDWGKAYQYNQALTDTLVSVFRFSGTSNQKRDAKALRMLYGAQMAVNRSIKAAWTNADRVYKRDISDGLSAKQAKKFAALTYVSDLVLLDSFIASSDLSRIASNKLSALTGAEKDLTLMTYSLMPFVIRRQVHDSRHIYNLERMGGRNSKIASELLTYDLFKNKCLTETLHYGYNQFEKYLGFDPVHRILRHTKHSIQKMTGFLDKWVFDPLIGGAVRLVTFNQFSGKDLQKAFNGTLGFAESIGFAMVKGVVHLPKHIYKDTKDLSHQLGRVLTGQSTWKGSWDALGRDTKGPRKTLKFAFNVSPAGWIWHKAHGNSDPILQKWGNLFDAASVGISAALHQAQIKKDMALAHFEIQLHQSLHEWSPRFFNSPYQLVESSYPKKFKQLKKDREQLKKDREAFQSKLTQRLLAQLDADMTPKLTAKLTVYMTKYTLDKKFGIKPSVPSKVTAQFDAIRAGIADKIKTYDPSKKISHYLFAHTTLLKKQFKQIHQREVARFKRQVKFLEFAHAYRTAINDALYRAARIGKERRERRFIDKRVDNLVKGERMYIRLKENLRSQIQNDWTNGGEKLFKHLFIYPISINLKQPKNRSTAINTEISDIQKSYQSRHIGEKVFADILLGDLVSRLLHDKSIVTYGKAAGARLDKTPYGKNVMRLVKWQTKDFVSRMRFVLSVANVSVNEADVQKFTSSVKERSLAMIQSSGFKTFVGNHAWAAVDLAWYKKYSSGGYFLKSWKKRIDKDASNNNKGTAARWQEDVNDIKSGQTLTVGQIVNSLGPGKNHWSLTLEKPAITNPVAPAHSSNTKPEPGKNPSEVQPTEPVKVSLLGFKSHIHFAKKLYKKTLGKKSDPIKDDAKTVKDETETDIDTDIDTAIDATEKDLAHDIEHTVEESVEADILDTEALIADAEIDILA